MKYSKIKPGIFLERPNRFIALVEIEGKVHKCHVKNTGRCRELLIPGATVYLQGSDNPARKTAYDLISVYKGERLINLDSQAPNAVFGESADLIFADIQLLHREYTYKSSRFDFYIEAAGRKILVEVKGVTLEEEGVVAFPDAPTQRGLKHIRELIDARQNGYDCYLCFVVQMQGVKYFVPNDAAQPEFGQALRQARQAGVNLLAYDCMVDSEQIVLNNFVEIRL